MQSIAQRLKKRQASSIVIFGYLLIAIMLIISISNLQESDEKLKAHYQAMVDSKNQVVLINSLHTHARNRTVLLMEMLIKKDFFAIDSIRQKFLAEANLFGIARAKLLAYPLTPEMAELWTQQKKSTFKNLKLQDQVVDFILEEDYAAAESLLLNQTLPVQTETLAITLKIEQLLKAAEKEAAIAYQKTVAADDSMAAVIHISLLGLILLVGLFSFGQARHRERQDAKQHAMDSHILSEVTDYIGLTDDKGLFMRVNPILKGLLAEKSIPSDTPLCKTLSLLSGNHSESYMNDLSTAIKEQGIWRSEIYIETSQPFYAMCEVRKLSHSEIDHATYLLLITNVNALKEAQHLLEQQANQDAVTELPNRHCFQYELSHYTHIKQPFGLLYIDLDHFKNVNDTLGHHYGDELLKAVSYRMENILLREFHDQFMLARIGGDEFAVILTGEEDNLDLLTFKLSELLCSELDKEFKIKDRTIKISASIGIALYPTHAQNNNAIMRSADLAMYEAKSLGKNRHEYFSPSLTEKLNLQIQLENDIEQALISRDFSLHFQPQYQLDSLKIVGLEALIRWKTDSKNISPAEFIPFAEKNGLIQKIGRYVIQEACQQISIWKKEGILPLDIKVALNISTQELSNPSFFANLNKQLVHFGVDSHNIELEITEYSLADNMETEGSTTNNILSLLEEKGIGVSIDDFGTGYSSLAYLKNMHIDRLKIDSSFIKDMTNSQDALAIVETIIVLGHKVGAKVIAEGIETAEQLELLKKIGCDEGQGYYLARPQPVTDIDTLLKIQHSPAH
ncbi:MAG: EAL domain-containing protein [Gammaproteobacteria bacterium]|nr:EAL domain-containing protein [Gammaproteobacteria bacterium]